MRLKSITRIVAFGLWTTLTLGGSIWGFLVILGQNSVSRFSNIRSPVISSDNTILQLIVVLTPILCGGGLWGLGIARLMKADAKSMMKACALSWSITIIALIMAVVFMATSQGVGFSKINFLPYFPHYRHYNFLLVFVTSVGIITAVNAYVVAGKLGLFSNGVDPVLWLWLGSGKRLPWDAHGCFDLQYRRSAGWRDGNGVEIGEVKIRIG